MPRLLLCLVLFADTIRAIASFIIDYFGCGV
jgi:hypothetical protein